ncbi:late blight resistance protein R1-A-like [Nicotiana tabacum]|uniref:Late blight resistance protein R1-A-like n=1 Tax=Nicotiana tabacum TaxID=4097 RepID=A0AC58U2A3_TOBAC
MVNQPIVGLEDMRNELTEKLTKGCRELDVISIIGMPGLVYKRIDLLLAILNDVIGESPSVSTEADVADLLRKTLFQKRYLILFDDVREASVWYDLRGCFRDANNGSRIILTTRHFEAANYARSFSDHVPPRRRNDDESWKLLEDKVFAKVEKEEESWKQVATNLTSHIHEGTKAIEEHSYQDLPCHLKPCFLYFGAFLEDRVINISKLTKLWTSEGFIKSCEGKRLEDIAEGYLENLMGRNLVMGAKRSLDGHLQVGNTLERKLDRLWSVEERLQSLYSCGELTGTVSKGTDVDLFPLLFLGL